VYADTLANIVNVTLDNADFDEYCRSIEMLLSKVDINSITVFMTMTLVITTFFIA